MPTVTDANVVLHRLNPEYILGGRMKIDEKAAYDAIEAQLSPALDMTPTDVARGIVTVVNSNMARAIRIVSVERGYDPREFVLMAFGGAGALHAASVGKDLGMHKVMIPSNPGILCAVGLLASDIRSDYVKTCLLNLTPDNLDKINEFFQSMNDEATTWLDTEGIPQDKRSIVKRVDLRYAGQNFELTVDVTEDVIDEAAIARIFDQFSQQHKREYGFVRENKVLQIVNCRVAALGKVSTIQLKEQPYGGENAEKAIIGQRDVYFEETQGYVPTTVYNRDLLENGNVFAGPAIIEQMDATIVVPPGHTAQIDPYLNIMITYESEAGTEEGE